MIMEWYRRSSRLCFVAFRRYPTYYTKFRTPVQESFSRTSFYQNFSKPDFNKSRISEFSLPVFSNSALQDGFKSVKCNSPFLNGAKRFYSLPIFRNSALQNGIKLVDCNSPFLNGAKRFYSLPIFSNSALQSGIKSVDCNSPFLNGAKRFYSGRQKKYREWIDIDNLRNLVASLGFIFLSALLSINPVAFIALYILLEDENENPKMEVLMHEQNENKEILMHKQNGHLETVPFTNRVHYNTISREYEEEWGRHLFEDGWRRPYKDRVLPYDHPENIRVQRIARSIIEALERGLEGTKSKKRDLEGLKWEVIVVDHHENDAYSFPGGKIVILTELLKHITSDAELACVIAHEVAHSVARHEAEIYSKFKWLDDSKPIMEQISAPSFSHILRLLLIVPLHMWLDFEADYIGLLLMGRGGYDPQVAPRLIKKLGYPRYHAFLRFKLLSRAKVMQEAMCLYMETIEKELRALRNLLEPLQSQSTSN